MNLYVGENGRLNLAAQVLNIKVIVLKSKKIYFSLWSFIIGHGIKW